MRTYVYVDGFNLYYGALKGKGKSGSDPTKLNQEESGSDPDFYGFAYSTNWLLPLRMIHCPMPRPSWSPFGVKSQVEPAPWKLMAVPARTSFSASTTSSTSWPGPLPTAMICFDQSTAIGLFAFSIASAVMAIWSCVLGGKSSTRSAGASISCRNFL